MVFILILQILFNKNKSVSNFVCKIIQSCPPPFLMIWSQTTYLDSLFAIFSEVFVSIMHDAVIIIRESSGGALTVLSHTKLFVG